MKKVTFFIMTAAVIGLFASCGKGHTKVDLKNNSDSVSYAMGAMTSMQMGLNKEVLQQQASILPISQTSNAVCAKLSKSAATKQRKHTSSDKWSVCNSESNMTARPSNLL